MCRCPAASGTTPVSWTASVSTTSGGAWLSVSPASGTTPASISVAVNSAALGVGAYNGQVSINAAGSAPAVVSVTLNVTSGPACTYSISPTSRSHSSLSETGSVAVTAPAGCSWTAVSNASWLTVTAGSSGSGNGTVSYSVAANSSASARTGTLTIAGATFTVNQAAARPPTIGASPVSLEFTTLVGTNPPPQNITVSNLGSGTLSWLGTVSYTTGTGWLSITPPGGNAPTTASVSVDVITPRLTAGTYRGQIVISALSGAANSPLSAPVTVVVNSPVQLAVSPQFLGFQVPQGSAPPSQALSITNAGTGALNWTASATTSTGGNWLALSATGGTAPATLVVAVNPAGLTPGVYSGLVSITETASNQTVPVTVALAVNPAAGTILLSQSDFVYTTPENSSAPVRQSLRILNIGQGALSWRLQATIPSGGNWLSVEQGGGSSGTDPASAQPVGVVVNPAGLPSGNHYGLLIVSGDGASNSPQLAAAHLRVVPPTSAPVASVLPSGFIFSTFERGPSPAVQTFSVQNVGGGLLPFTVRASTADGVAWLSASPTQATAPANITVQVNSGGLRARVYRGRLELVFPGGATQELSVLLVITPPAIGITSLTSSGQGSAACTPSELHGVSTVLANNFGVLVGWPVPILVRLVDNCHNAVTAATVVASFAGSGDPPLVLRSLRDGVYSAIWVPLAHQRVRLSIRALSPPLRETTIELSGQVEPFAAGLPVIRGATNAASFAPNAPVAPGSIISLFGQNFAAQELTAPRPLPRSLGGLALKIGDLEAPLFYVGPGQVNAQVPFELASSTAASLVTIVNGRVTPPEQLLIAPVQPGIFFYEDRGVMRGAVLDAENRIITASNAAERGKAIQIFATGLGATNPPVRTGDPAPSDPLALASTPLEATIGAIDAHIDFKGLTPGFSGLYQVNVVVPSGLPAGDLPLVLIANGIRSNEVMLAVR